MGRKQAEHMDVALAVPWIAFIAVATQHGEALAGSQDHCHDGVTKPILAKKLPVEAALQELRLIDEHGKRGHLADFQGWNSRSDGVDAAIFFEKELHVC